MQYSAEWYEGNRDRLLNFINDTLKLEITDKYREELERIKKKCQEDQFEIVLCGEFQGGKSTTFNAICDGRDLSPRGLGGGGIKTSAAIISAQNISDENENERAEISYKTKNELLEYMKEILFDDIENWDELDLDKPSDQKQIKEILDKYWKSYNCDKEEFDTGLLDPLRITTLIMKFYGTWEYNELCKKETVGLFEFQKYITFPKGWEKKWGAGANADFLISEVAFIFIAGVLLRIKSKNLHSHPVKF